MRPSCRRSLLQRWLVGSSRGSSLTSCGLQVVPYVPGLKVVTQTRVGGVELGHILKFILTTPVQVGPVAAAHARTCFTAGWSCSA